MVCSILYQSNKHDYRFVLEKYLVTRSRVFILNQTSQNTGKANSSLSHTHTHTKTHYLLYEQLLAHGNTLVQSLLVLLQKLLLLVYLSPQVTVGL